MEFSVPVPEFWANDLERIGQVVKSIKKGKVSLLAKSQGQRDIFLIEYGEKQDFKRKANYRSACAYRDPRMYANKTGLKPTVLLVGAIHGGEIEGVTALLNLIQELETGKDFLGRSHAWVAKAQEEARLLIIPCLNVDGRARVPFSICTQVSEYEVVYYKHGLWKDGSLADYTTGFREHPILDAVDHMGGYYNDIGVNPAADNAFDPMSVESAALVRLADREAPDFTLMLHTGCHKHGKLMQPFFIPGYILDHILAFDEILQARFEGAGFGYYSLQEHGVVYEDHMKFPAKGFDISSAIHHSCGGASMTYESYEATHEEKDIYYLSNILDCHFMLFEEALRYSTKLRDHMTYK